MCSEITYLIYVHICIKIIQYQFISNGCYSIKPKETKSNKLFFINARSGFWLGLCNLFICQSLRDFYVSHFLEMILVMDVLNDSMNKF